VARAKRVVARAEWWQVEILAAGPTGRSRIVRHVLAAGRDDAWEQANAEAREYIETFYTGALYCVRSVTPNKSCLVCGASDGVCPC